MAILSEGASGASKFAEQVFNVINSALFDLADLTVEENFPPEFNAGVRTLLEAHEAKQANEGEAVTPAVTAYRRTGMTMQMLKDLGAIDD